MKLSELNDKLIQAARATPPDDRVPYSFEKRVMARLAGQKVLDVWSVWGQALSRAAMICVAVMSLLTLGSLFLPTENPPPLPQDVQMTLFAAVDRVDINTPDESEDIW